MIKYIIKYNQEGVNHNEIILENKGGNKWFHSVKYYGSSTREGLPIACCNEQENKIYKSIGFTLLTFNTETLSKEVIGDFIIIEDVVRDLLNSRDTDKPVPLKPSIKLDLQNIGSISFSFRDLYRWPGKPLEIRSCLLELV